VLQGPNKTVVEALLEPIHGTPVQILARDKKGKVLLTADYGAFEEEDGQLLPTEVHIAVPDLDLTVDLKYKNWKFPEEPPDVFTVAAPEGFLVEDLGEIVVDLAEGADKAKKR
jgi:hypothetical protein